MYKNFIIYFIILILLLVIFYIYFKKINKNSENFLPWDFNNKSEDVPNFVKDYENIYTEKSKNELQPNYKNENITMYNFKRLFDKVAQVNKEKITLKDRGNYNFYTQSTTDDKLRMDLDMISKYVILLLNKDGYYDFNKTNFGDVEIWIDKFGNEELKYELFLWDKKNYFEIKLWVNIIKFVDSGEVDKYGVKEKHYIFQDFNIGYPFKDQIIPLPTDVVITGHFDTSTDSISPNEPTKIKHLYLNQIEIQNSTLIVDYHKNKYPFNRLDVNEENKDQFSGITDMSLEYVNIKGVDHNPYLENSRKYNKWPTLDEEPKWKGQYPSKPPPKHWDADGIYYYGKKDPSEITFTKDDELPFSDKRLCDIYEPGTRWSDEKEPLQPYYWPTLASLPRNCGENYWLFDLTNGANGTFFGGGKK
jgi:hypothetical protein